MMAHTRVSFLCLFFLCTTKTCVRAIVHIFSWFISFSTCVFHFFLFSFYFHLRKIEVAMCMQKNPNDNLRRGSPLYFFNIS
jgi:hypothetical protein